MKMMASQDCVSLQQPVLPEALFASRDVVFLPLRVLHVIEALSTVDSLRALPPYLRCAYFGVFALRRSESACNDTRKIGGKHLPIDPGVASDQNDMSSPHRYDAIRAKFGIGKLFHR